MTKEDVLFRRLGMALKDTWGGVPPFAQDQILDRACEVECNSTGQDVRATLKDFLEVRPTEFSARRVGRNKFKMNEFGDAQTLLRVVGSAKCPTSKPRFWRLAGLLF